MRTNYLLCNYKISYMALNHVVLVVPHSAKEELHTLDKTESGELSFT